MEQTKKKTLEIHTIKTVKTVNVGNNSTVVALSINRKSTKKL